MMYPFFTLDDMTEIVHSEYLSGRVKVYVEKPDEKDGFHNLTCYLPNYEIEEVYGFGECEVDRYIEIIKANEKIILSER